MSAPRYIMTDFYGKVIAEFESIAGALASPLAMTGYYLLGGGARYEIYVTDGEFYTFELRGNKGE